MGLKWAYRPRGVTQMAGLISSGGTSFWLLMLFFVAVVSHSDDWCRIVKRNAKAFSLNAIVDVRLRRRHEMICFEYLAKY